MAQMTNAQLAATLRSMAASVEAGDSYEGNIAYSFGTQGNTSTVQATWRVGNSMGQGGMRMVELVEGEEL